MEIKLNYTEEEAIKLFESHGFEVITDKVEHRVPIHGSAETEYTTTQKVVLNPHTQEKVLLQNAIQRLFKRKFLDDMYWIGKVDVLNALDCLPVKDPFEPKAPEHHN